MKSWADVIGWGIYHQNNGVAWINPHKKAQSAVMEFRRYHLQYYISSALVVLFSLLAIIWLNETLRLLELVVSRGGSLIDFALMSIFPIPLWLMLALPVSAFISVIWVLQKFLSDREMIVMQAIGMNQAQLTLPALLFGGMMTVFLILNSVYILPLGFSAFKALQNDIRASIPKILIKDGEFIDLDKGLTIFIGEKQGRREIGNVFIQDNRRADKFVTFTAQKGVFDTEKGRAVLKLENGQRTELNQDGSSSALLSFESHMIDISRTGVQNNNRLYLDANEERITTLLNPDPSMPARYQRERIAEGHFRIASPFLALSLCMIAACLMGKANSDRHRTTSRLSITVVAGLAVLIGTIVARSFIVTNVQFWPLLYIIICGPIMAGLIYLFRPQPLQQPQQDMS